MPLRRRCARPARLGGVFDQGHGWFEVKVTLDLQAEAQASVFQLGLPHAAQLGRPEAEIAKAEEDVFVVRIALADEPRRCPTRIEQLQWRLHIRGVLSARRPDAIGAKLPVDFLSDEFHGLGPFVRRVPGSKA